MQITEKEHKFLQKIEKKKEGRKSASASFTKENVQREVIAGKGSSRLYMEYPFSQFSLKLEKGKCQWEEAMSDIFAMIDDQSQEETMIFTGKEGRYHFPGNSFLFGQVDLCFLDPDGKFLLRTKADDLSFDIEKNNPEITLHDLHAHFDAVP